MPTKPSRTSTRTRTKRSRPKALLAGSSQPDAKDLLKASVCLQDASKDLRGALRVLLERPHICVAPSCASLKVVHSLDLRVRRHAPCDQTLYLDGPMRVANLVTIFHGDAFGRGVHAGEFRWEGPKDLIVGTLRGVTNVGTHRDPAFRACQRCMERGVLEGTLSGNVVRTRDPERIGAWVTAAYRIRFDPTSRGGEGAVQGTMEGVLAIQCR